MQLVGRKHVGTYVKHGKKRRQYDTLRVKISADRKERREYRGAGNFPATEADEVLQLRPTTRQEMLDAAALAYARMDTEAVNFNQIAVALNEIGAPHPAYADQWKVYHVRELLQNPAYIGYPTS